MAATQKGLAVCTLVLGMVLAVFAQAQAQDSLRRGDRFMCMNGDSERRVEVHYFELDDTVPCEVRYYKDTEEPGMEQVLWRADNQAGYCEDKTATFVDQLSVWGWDCNLQSDTPPDLEAGTMSGDTGVMEDSGTQLQ